MVFWGLAESLAGLSCCRRGRVGCIVVTPDLTEVLAVGYNGPPAGAPNDSCRGPEAVGACGCAHAEGNALAKLRDHRAGLVMMTTTLQCEHCAGLVVNSGRVGYVIHGVPYRDPAGADLLRRSGLVVVSVGAVLGDGGGAV